VGIRTGCAKNVTPRRRRSDNSKTRSTIDVPGGDSPKQHAAAIRSEVVRWAQLVKKAGLDKTY